MTRENLEARAEDARKVLGQLDSALQERKEEVRKARDGIAKEREHVLSGARAALHVLDEADDPLRVEQEKLRRVTNDLNAETHDEEPAPQPWSEPPVSMAPPPPPPPMSGAVASAPASHEAPGRPQDRTDVIPAVRPERVRVHALDVRHWDGRQWLIAAIGLLIGLVVATFTWHPLVATGHIYGGGRAVFVTFWFLCLGGIGFFGGGQLGYQTEERGGDWEED